METPQPNGCGVSFFRLWGFFFRLRGLFFFYPIYSPYICPIYQSHDIRDIIQRYNTGIKKGPSPVTGRLLLSVLLAQRSGSAGYHLAIGVVTLHNLPHVALGLTASGKFAVADQLALIYGRVGLHVEIAGHNLP